jgi:hypothetical protein
MMFRKLHVAVLLFLLSLLWTAAVQAQEPRPSPTPTDDPRLIAGQTDEPQHGSIRGTIRLDQNGDGRCANEPILADIPIRFVSDDGNWSVYLRSGDNGTYGLVAAGYGTWKVTADPPAPYVVTSQKTINAFLGDNQKLVLGVDFCVADIRNVRAQAPVVLPQSGGVAPGLLTAVFVGAAFVFSGMALEWHRRRQA